MNAVKGPLLPTQVALESFVCEKHRDQVIALVPSYDYPDRIPTALSFYEHDPDCCPFVLIRDNHVLAFMNARLFTRNTQSERVVFVEGIRVKHGLNGCGLATVFLEKAMDALVSRGPPAKTTRFLACVMPSTLAMLRVFEKCQWTLHREFCSLPDYFTRMKLPKTDFYSKGTLGAMGIKHLVPDSARNILEEWKIVSSASELTNLLQQRRASTGVDLCIKRVHVQTYAQTARFLEQENGIREARSAWKLQRNDSLPALLFARSPHHDHLMPSLGAWEMTAMVSDVEEAECAVVLADRLAAKSEFALVFDHAVTQKVIRSSTFLSSAEPFSYYLYEAFR